MQNYFAKPDPNFDSNLKNIYARDRVVSIIGSMVLKNNKNLMLSEFNLD